MCLKITRLTVYSLLLLSLFSCKQKEKFAASKAGMEYRIVTHDAGGIPAQPGQYLKLSLVQRYGDTILRDPAKTGYEYQLIDSAQMTQESWHFFKSACVGDSMVFRVSSDSAFKTKKPAFVRRKDWLVTTVKVVSILANADSVYADREREREKYFNKR
jgi:hypothetical protein